MMRTIKAVVSYDGSQYLGFQRQSRGSTIQAELEKAISKLVAASTRVAAASRTDAGVHATGQVIHFRVSTRLKDRELARALNAILPRDIAIRRLVTAAEKFHARYHAQAKLYRYRIYRGHIKPVFDNAHASWIRGSLDVARMKKAARALRGRHDFTSFSRADKAEKSRIRSIDRIFFREKPGFLEIDFEGDGFLRNMIRIVVGTLIDVGRGQLDPGQIRQILEARNRLAASATAQARGLTLMRVRYGKPAPRRGCARGERPVIIPSSQDKPMLIV